MAEVNQHLDAEAMATLRTMEAADPGFMSRIIDLFLVDLRERMETIRSAVQARDAATIKATAHALKGSCGPFGATRLATLCRKIDQVVTQQESGDWSATLREMEDEVEQIRNALHEAGKGLLEASGANDGAS